MACILYGIGDNSTNKFRTNTIAVTDGKFPTPTSTSWSIEATKGSEQYMSCKLDSGSGILGLSGATYTLEMKDSTNKVSATLQLKDTLGMVLTAARNDKYLKGSSYEYAMPSLSIQPGSSIEIDGNPTKLVSGEMWLDRQAIGGSDKKARKNDKKSHELYTGDWLVVAMEHAIYELSFMWPPTNPQWIVGDELDPPIPPTPKSGLRYPRLPDWDNESAILGVTILEKESFNLNIKDPKDKGNSPHWKSKSSDQTYCTEWKLELEGKPYKMVAVVPGSEVYFDLPKVDGVQIIPPQYFFEGAALIYDDEGKTLVGHAFVEQMGYN